MTMVEMGAMEFQEGGYVDAADRGTKFTVFGFSLVDAGD